MLNVLLNATSNIDEPCDNIIIYNSVTKYIKWRT